MDVYGEKVLKELGLPTAIKSLKDLNAFQILKLDPAIDDSNIIHEASTVQIRKLRHWQKHPYKDFAGRMELAIIKARKMLANPEIRAKLRAQVQGSPQLAAATMAAKNIKHPEGAWVTEAETTPEKSQGIPKWVNLLIILALVGIGLIVINSVFGGIGGIVESIKKMISPN